MKQESAHWKQDEYAKVYMTYFPKLVRFSQAYLPSRHEAENVVQDVFLYLWEHPALRTSMLSIQAFLFTMTKNRCIDFLRKQVRTLECSERIADIQEKEWELKLYSIQQLDESRFSTDELETVLRKAIDSLPERCRTIFILSRMDGMRHKEIAERLAISPNTVERQIQIALKKLRGELKGYAFLLALLLINVKV
jgi:RNA polymerase sigma-70 factor (ECF subfamily)